VGVRVAVDWGVFAGEEARVSVEPLGVPSGLFFGGRPFLLGNELSDTTGVGGD